MEFFYVSKKARYLESTKVYEWCGAKRKEYATDCDELAI